MKKTLLILCLTLTSIIAFGQSRLGTSSAQIKSEFKDSIYEMTSGYDDEGDYFIAIESERAYVTYYFDSDKTCYLTLIEPDDQGALNYYVELYNDQYVIVSPRKWKMYSENGISNIELEYPEDGGFFFSWTY